MVVAVLAASVDRRVEHRVARRSLSAVLVLCSTRTALDWDPLLYRSELT